MLPNPEEHHRYTRGMDHTDQRTHHIAHRIAFRDDEPIQPASTTFLIHELSREISRLGHRIGSHERLSDHEDLIRIRQLPELGERRHEPCIIMPPSRRVDEHDIERQIVRRRGRRLRGESHRLLGYDGRVLPVALLEEFHVTYVLAAGEFREVADVHAELLHGSRAEGVGCADEDAVGVLEEEVR